MKKFLKNLMKKHRAGSCDLYKESNGELTAKYKKSKEKWKFKDGAEPINILKCETKETSTYGTIGIVWGIGSSGKTYKVYLKKNGNKIIPFDYTTCKES